MAQLKVTFQSVIVPPGNPPEVIGNPNKVKVTFIIPATDNLFINGIQITTGGSVSDTVVSIGDGKTRMTDPINITSANKVLVITEFLID